MDTKKIISEYLTEEDLEVISQLIKDVESKTSGELRLCIKKKRGYFETDFSPRELAVNEFHRLGMDKTADRTGVLFFIIFDEHKFEILADTGINQKIPEDYWSILTDGIVKRFSENKYLDGIIYLISSVGEVLIKEFPVNDTDVNELSDDILIS